MPNSVKTTAELIEEVTSSGDFTYRKLAQLTSTDHAYLHNIAKGRKYPPNNIEFFEKLAKALKKKPTDFLEYRKLCVLKFLDKNLNHYQELYDRFITYASNFNNEAVNLGRAINEHTGLKVDDDAYQIWVDDNILDLTSKEFGLLSYLYNNEGKILTREALLREVWGFDYFGGTRTVDVHIRRLRAKLEPRYHDTIETIRNIGYRFRKP